MVLPTNAIRWKQPIDPSELLDFAAEFQPLLEVDEQIVTFTVALMAEAVAAGVQIVQQAGRAPMLVNSNTRVRLWFEVVDEFREDPIFNGNGIEVGVVFTIHTNSDPARRRQRTYALRVAQQ
jgi:hypothetical protein